MPNTPFKSKSEEKRVRTTLGATSDGHEAFIHVWPIEGSKIGFAIAAKVDGKGLKSQICLDKAAILKFLDEVL